MKASDRDGSWLHAGMGDCGREVLSAATHGAWLAGSWWIVVHQWRRGGLDKRLMADAGGGSGVACDDGETDGSGLWVMDLADGATGVFQDLLLDRSRWEKLLVRGDGSGGAAWALTVPACIYRSCCCHVDLRSLL
ncbi:hypothetical protein ACLOJK_036357 [Asimina triloba]